MRKLMASISVAAMFAGGGSALAADFVEPDAGLFDWSGFYAGAHVGYAWNNFDGVFDPSEDPGIEFDEQNMDSFLIGLHGGFNFQMDSWLLGIEADGSFMPENHEIGINPNGSVPFELHMDYLASIRARLGVTFDNTLIFVTGGIAFTDAELNVSVTDNPFRSFDVDAGGVVGGGIEHAVSDHVSLRAEGLYYIFNEDHDMSDVDGEGEPGNSFELDNSVVIRVGATFHLNGH